MGVEHLRGDWIRPSAEDDAVIEPATGGQLSTVGMATGEDVSRAADQAARA
jgi:benzaldehyde dehydrogenase (NAD)